MEPQIYGILEQARRLTSSDACAICGIKLKSNEWAKENDGVQVYPHDGPTERIVMHLLCGPKNSQEFN